MALRRYVAEYAQQTDALLREYELRAFDLTRFQLAFGEADPRNPVVDCYPIDPARADFLRPYLVEEPDWDFVGRAYFLEAHVD
ncbi:MAG: hypothetical protein R3202_10925 [Candidatus Competibacterales bacterium]|nr:hypothetical protein [Candidatus Competibacterales bacterium]